MTATDDASAILRSIGRSPILRCFPEGVIIAFDFDLRYVSVGGRPLGEVGLSPQQLEGRTIFDVFPADVVAVLEPLYRQALAGQDTTCDVRYKDRIVRQRLGPLIGADGDVVGGLGFTQDVTEDLRAVQALRMSEERFRVAFDSGPVGMVMVSLDGRYQQVNGAMCTFTGYRREQLLGRRVREITHPEDVEADQAKRAELLGGSRSSYTVEKRYLTPDGQLRWGTTSAALIRDKDGSALHFIGQVLDITAKKLDEQRILDERRRLHEAEAIGRTGSWEMDVATRAVSWSAGMFALWGIEHDQFGGNYAAAARQVHPDDRDAVDAAVSACAAHGEPIDHSFRVIRADGAIRWITSKGEARYVDGQRVRVGGVIADITEQRRASEEAAAARSFLEAVFTASPDVIAVWDLNTWSIVWNNRAITDHLGYSAAEAAALSSDLAANLVVPEDYPALLASVEEVKACADGEVAEVAFRMMHRDGSPRWFSRRAAPLLRDADGRVLHIVGISRDISEAKRVEAALLESQSLFRELAESVDVAFVLRTWDPDEFLYLSPTFGKIFGYDPLLAGESPSETTSAVHPDDRENFERDYLMQARAGRPAAAEYRIVRPDGEVRWIRSKSSPVRDHGGIIRRSASTSEDVTVSRQTEAALLSAREAEKANAAKNEFLSRMSHELRTPLNSVLGFAQLLELDELTVDQQNATRHILRGGRHLVGLIDDVLEIAKIESDRLEMSLELVPVAALLAETVELMSPQAQAAEVTLTYHPSGSASRPVHADHRRLRQVVLNLLSNAIKYNRCGGRVDITCSISDDLQLEIVVRDTGRGIRAEHLPRLFTPFDRLDADSTGVEGTGVGLALSQRLMTLMGGRLTATSRPGSGSTFTACIPLADEEWTGPADALELLAAQTSEPDAPTGPGRTVLYIEDNTSNIELMERLLMRRPGWSMVVAGHGALGVELASTTKPDLVLLDLHLPDMTGFDVLERLRSAPGTADLDIVVISADANRRNIDRLLAAGASAYLTKPLDVARVLELLD